MHKHSTGVEQGFVSIFSVLIIMAILTVVLVGFSNATRQAEQRTLDYQLSTQAFYAAESGINAARAKLEDDPTYTKDTCDGGEPEYFKYTLSGTLGVGYSCVLINPNPENISISSVGVMGRTVASTVNMESEDGTPIREFDVNWDSKSGGALPSTGSPQLISAGAWGDRVGMVRMDIIPNNNLSRDGMANNAYTYYLYPSSSAGTSGTVTMTSGAGQGTMTLVRCASSGNYRCKVTIRLGSTLHSGYSIRLQALYSEVKVDINNIRNNVGSSVTLRNGQVIVDSTGQANEVFRRVQVRLNNIKNGTTTPFALLSADSICKRLEVGDNTVGHPTTYDVADNAACAIDP